MALTEQYTTGVITIRRDNVILDIPAEQKDYYKNLGYSVIDEKTGEVVDEAIPTDVASLQSLYKDAKAEIAELEAEIKKLKAAKAPKKAEKPVVEKSEQPAVEEPKTATSTSYYRKRKSSKA